MSPSSTLLNYLNEHFYTRSQLLARANIGGADFDSLLAQGLIPSASYRVKLSLRLDSFFGDKSLQEGTEYYAKGYLGWLKDILALQAQGNEKQSGATGVKAEVKAAAFSGFCLRYQAQLAKLAAAGFASEHMQDTDKLNELLALQWQHFLKGTYGLCTRSGLPEDIAAKELAIEIIKILVGEGLERAPERLAMEEKAQLARAVDLLDSVASEFAPHERKLSSRELYINRVRLKYGLNQAAAAMV
ncbi:hypothetical protein SG34_019035 [Thalassomonas viridans]|uniref:Uncharacterized protein n=1 Tax=Thalassomonas viridans TaxID=137584 RepID=A0AAE9YYC4_9GAMM|nr:DUF6058 family natural product biosynthesis protein [Thalassomonas viridans]WDE03476.1 hypothetical protein SG34_019035 [Thalassomonas viridans]